MHNAPFVVPADRHTFVGKLYTHMHFLSVYILPFQCYILKSCNQGLHTHTRSCVLCFLLVLWLASLHQRRVNTSQLQMYARPKYFTSLKSIRVHLSPGNRCGLVAYTCATVYFLYGTYSYLLRLRRNDISSKSKILRLLKRGI